MNYLKVPVPTTRNEKKLTTKRRLTPATKAELSRYARKIPRNEKAEVNYVRASDEQFFQGFGLLNDLLCR